METHLAAPPAHRAVTVPVPTNLLGDERLARLVGQGNERAFTTLYSRYHQQLYRYCRSILRHEEDAQDALQATFTAALSALRRSQRNAPLRPWLYRIAHNEAISLLRRRPGSGELPETLPDNARSAEASAEERAQLAALVSDLQALPERQREALVMRELNGLSHEELAQALGISVGGAKQTVFEARQALHEFAEGRAMACDQIQRIVSDGDGRALRGRRVRAHLRDCVRCRAFAQAIPERRAALLALSPALPAAAAAGVLQKVTGAAHHGAGGGGGLLAGAGGKSLGVALSAKTMVTGIAIVGAVTAGAVGTVEVVSHSGHSSVKTQVLRHNRHGSTAGGLAVAGRRSTAHHGARTSGHGSRGAGAHRGAQAHSRLAGHGSHRARHAASSSSTHPRGTNSNSHGGNSNAHGGNSNAHSGNPKSSGGGSSNAHGSNPNAHGGNPNAHGGNPNARGGNPKSHGGTNPNAHGGNPNAHGGNPNAHGGNPKSHGGSSSNAHGGNPNAKKGQGK